MTNTLSQAQLAYQKRYGLLFGGIFAAVIGSIWGTWVAAYLGDRGGVMIGISIAILITLISLVFSVRRKRPLVKIDAKLPYLSFGVFWAKFYGVVIAEVAVILLIINWLNAHQLSNGVIPTIAFIVAAHFAILGMLNGVKIWYGTAIVICGGIAVTLATTPSTNVVVIGDAITDTWTLMSVSIFTLSLWVTSLACSLLYLYGNQEGKKEK
jgi:hypothetical protein